MVAVEEPLQIRIGSRNIAITMRTPGQDAELAAGFLFTEGIVQPGEIQDIACTRNTAVVTLAPGVQLDPSRLERNFYVSIELRSLRKSLHRGHRVGRLHHSSA